MLDSASPLNLLRETENALKWITSAGVSLQETALGFSTQDSYQVSSLSLAAEQTGLNIIGLDGASQNVKLVDQLLLQSRIKEVVLAFNSYDYSKATKLLEALLAISTNAKTTQILGAVKDVSEAYARWDEFDYSAAVPLLGKAYGVLRIWRKEILDVIQLDQVEKNLSFLSNLLKETKKVTYPSELLALDLWKNGLRRYYERNNSDAIIRFYRSVEAMIQTQMHKEYGIDASNFVTPYPVAIKEETIRTFLSELGFERPPKKLGLNDGLVLLRILKDPFANQIPEKVVAGLQTSRNQCVLTHGLGLPSEEAVLGFSRDVEAILRLFVKNQGNDPDWNSADHIALDASTLPRITFV